MNFLPLTKFRKKVSKSKIPRNIMQTYKTKILPLHWQASQDSIKKYMSNWTYMLFDDKDNRKLVEELRPDLLKYYDEFKHPIMRVDFARVLFLKKYGGIYIDCDFELQKSLEPLFDSGSSLYFIKSHNVGKYLTNSFMASVPNHPFLDQYLNEMVKPAPIWAFGKHLHVMQTTGPMALTRSVNIYKPIFSLLPQQQIIPCSICEIGRCMAPSAYIKTLPGQSWNSWDSLLYNYIFCNYKEIIIYIFISILIIYALLYIYKKKFPWN